MFLNFLVLAASIIGIASDKEIAYVDLTAVPSDLASGSGAKTVRGGGILHHGTPNQASPQTPTLSLSIIRLIANKKGGAPQAVELTATNVGNAPVAVPVGLDSSKLLNSSEKSRRYLLFSVSLTGPIQVGVAESACNAGHPDSNVLLQPGDHITFLLPMNVGSMIEAGKEVSVSVQFYERVDEKGKEWDQAVGDPIKSTTLAKTRN